MVEKSWVERSPISKLDVRSNFVVEKFAEMEIQSPYDSDEWMKVPSPQANQESGDTTPL